MIIFHPKHIEDLPSKHPSATIFLIQLREPFFSLLKSLDSCKLKRFEHSGIHLTLHLENLRNNLSISRNHSYSPSGHVMCLAERIQLQATLLGSRQ